MNCVCLTLIEGKQSEDQCCAVAKTANIIHSGSQKWSAPVLTFCSHCEGLTGTEIVWVLGKTVEITMAGIGLSCRRSRVRVSSLPPLNRLKAQGRLKKRASLLSFTAESRAPEGPQRTVLGRKACCFVALAQ